LDPLANADKDRKATLQKIEGILDEVYQDKTILPEHYSEFMKSYMQDFDEKLRTTPD